MTASQKLLVNLLVAASAVARSQPVSADDKTVMLFFLLSGGGWWHSRQFTPFWACLLISYSWTTEYWVREWHSAHLPEARTNSSPGCSVSTLGRARFIKNAATMSAKETATATNTDRKDMHQPPAVTVATVRTVWSGTILNLVGRISDVFSQSLLIHSMFSFRCHLAMTRPGGHLLNYLGMAGEII